MFLDPGWMIVILLVVLLIAGLPMAFVLGVTAATMILLDPAVVPQTIGLIPFGGANNYLLVAALLFMIAGDWTNQGRIAETLIAFASSLVDLHVIGIAEAAFNEVRRIGGPFAIVTFAPEVAAPLAEKAAEHGVAPALMRVASPEAALAHDPADVANTLLPTDARRAQPRLRRRGRAQHRPRRRSAGRARRTHRRVLPVRPCGWHTGGDRTVAGKARGALTAIGAPDPPH